MAAIIKGNQNTTRLINELKNAAKQYPPLSKEAEDKLIEENKGNREKLNKLLFMHNIRLVFNVAKKYMSKTDDFDAMVQDGMLGLAIAANNFDIERGVKFITYATPWVRKKVLERFYGRVNEITKRSVSLSSPGMTSNSKVNDGSNADLEDYVNEYLDPAAMQPKTFRQQVSADEQNMLCADLYNQLENDHSISERDKKIFVDLMYNRERAKDVQQMYGITSKDLSMIKDKILKSMKARLESHFGIHSFSDVYDA